MSPLKNYGSLWSIFVIFGILSFIFVTDQCGATTLHYLSIEDLVQEADEIIHGRVGAVEVFWTKDNTAIYTQVTLETFEHFKGNYDQHPVLFTLFGGEKDGVLATYQYRPVFTTGEEVVVFLRRTQDNTLTLMALSQGVWRVRSGPDKSDGLTFIRDVRGIMYSKQKNGQLTHFDANSTRKTVTPAELWQVVRKLNNQGVVQPRKEGGR